MIQVINGEIKQYQLPQTGTLKDGRTVSGYHLLDEEVLLDEGWLPLEDMQPIYDEDSQCLINDGYEILEDKVIKKYRIEENPEREEPSETEVLGQEMVGLKLDSMQKDQTISALGQELVKLKLEIMTVKGGGM